MEGNVSTPPKAPNASGNVSITPHLLKGNYNLIEAYLQSFSYFNMLNRILSFSALMWINVNKTKIVKTQLIGICVHLVASGSNVCTGSGDPHHRTFDGAMIHFQGICTYTFVKPCVGEFTSTILQSESRN